MEITFFVFYSRSTRANKEEGSMKKQAVLGVWQVDDMIAVPFSARLDRPKKKIGGNK